MRKDRQDDVQPTSGFIHACTLRNTQSVAGLLQVFNPILSGPIAQCLAGAVSVGLSFQSSRGNASGENHANLFPGLRCAKPYSDSYAHKPTGVSSCVMSPPPSSSKPLPLHKSFAASAIAACTAEVGTPSADDLKYFRGDFRSDLQLFCPRDRMLCLSRSKNQDRVQADLQISKRPRLFCAGTDNTSRHSQGPIANTRQVGGGSEIQVRLCSTPELYGGPCCTLCSVP